jgi:membrane protease YdiL (CAAX protease family)
VIASVRHDKGARSLEDQDRSEGNLPLANAESLLPLWVFLAASAALCWTVWLWPINHRLALITKFHGYRSTWPLYNIKMMIGGVLPGLLAMVWVGVQGKRQLRDLLSSLFAWRAKFIWYALSLALPSLVFALSACAVLMLFSGKHGGLSALTLVNTLLALPGVVSEEIAWRAFALRRLQQRYSRLSSALIIGVYWAVWHIPMWLLTLKFITAPQLVIICLNLVCWSIIFAFLYERSGQSLPVTILLHLTYMVASNQAATVVEFRTVTMIRIAAAISVCLALFFARRLAAKNPPKFSDPTGINHYGGCDLATPALTTVVPGYSKTGNDNFSDMKAGG